MAGHTCCRETMSKMFEIEAAHSCQMFLLQNGYKEVLDPKDISVWSIVNLMLDQGLWDIIIHPCSVRLD